MSNLAVDHEFFEFCMKIFTNVISQGYRKMGKGAQEPKAQTAGAYPGFLSMKHA